VSLAIRPIRAANRLRNTGIVPFKRQKRPGGAGPTLAHVDFAIAMRVQRPPDPALLPSSSGMASGSALSRAPWHQAPRQQGSRQRQGGHSRRAQAMFAGVGGEGPFGSVSARRARSAKAGGRSRDSRRQRRRHRLRCLGCFQNVCRNYETGTVSTSQ
jgi:hypothetical protein